MGITPMAWLQCGLNADGSRQICASQAALSMLPQVPELVTATSTANMLVLPAAILAHGTEDRASAPHL